MIDKFFDQKQSFEDELLFDTFANVIGGHSFRGSTDLNDALALLGGGGGNNSFYGGMARNLDKSMSNSR